MTDSDILNHYPAAQQLQMTARRIFCELVRRGVSVTILDGHSSVIQFTDPTSGRLRFCLSSLSDKTSAVSLRIADRKPATTALAQQLSIPTPAEMLFTMGVTPFHQAVGFMQHQDRVVVKPYDSAHGNGVTTNVAAMDSLQHAIVQASNYSEKIIIQKQVEGRDIRIIVIDGQYVSAMERIPASVTGDGQHTIAELIDRENSENSDRSADYTTLLSVISVKAAETYLGENMSDIPEAGQRVRVVGPANVSMGGDIKNAYHSLSDDVIEAAIQLTSALKLPCSGVDFIVGDDGAYWLIEINPTPALYEHDDPHWGIETGAIAKFVDALLK